MVKEKDFIEHKKVYWEEFETLVTKRKKNFDEVNRLMSLYYQVTEDLSYAQTHLPESNTLGYLNRIIQQGNLHFYRPKKTRLKDIILFIFIEFPAIIVRLWKPILLSMALFFGALLFSMILIVNNPSYTEIFLDDNSYEMAQEDMELRREFGNFDDIHENVRLPVSLYLWFHNSRVAITAFALGITFGLGTFYVILFNGFMVGALSGVYLVNGHFTDFISLILIHGSIELFAIMVAGGIGFNIAASILLPGRRKRGDNLKKAGIESLKCLFGIVLLLLWAGLEEGLITPLKLPIPMRFMIMGVNLLILTVYILVGTLLKRRGMSLQQRS